MLIKEEEENYIKENYIGPVKLLGPIDDSLDSPNAWLTRGHKKHRFLGAGHKCITICFGSYSGNYGAYTASIDNIKKGSTILEHRKAFEKFFTRYGKIKNQCPCKC